MGSFNTAVPAASFAGSTFWAVVKDNANLSPADLGTRNVILSTAVGSTEVLKGTDNAANVNLVAMVPEPSSALLITASAIGLMVSRRRAKRQVA